MIPTYQARPLVAQESTANDGFTHIGDILASDLTQATANTAQALVVLPVLPAGSAVLVEIRLRVPFKNSSDNAFNSTTVSVGDTGSATSLLTAQQLNANGSYVTVVRGSLSSVYTTANQVLFTFASMTGKSLSNLNNGELQYLLKVINPNPLMDAKQKTAEPVR